MQQLHKYGAITAHLLVGVVKPKLAEYKYGLQKTRDIGGALAEGITAIGTKQVQTFDDHMAAGYTLLPGPLGEDDPSGRIPEEASVSLTTAMERGKTFNNPIIRRKRG